MTTNVKSLFTFHLNSLVPFPLHCLSIDDQNYGTLGYLADQKVSLNIELSFSQSYLVGINVCILYYIMEKHILWHISMLQFQLIIITLDRWS